LRVTGDDVDPVPGFEPPHQRQHFVRGEIERVERQSQLVVFDKRKESKRAVSRPFHEQRLRAIGDGGLHEAGTLADGRHRVAAGLERFAIRVPRTRHRFRRIVKQVEAARDARRGERHTQRDAAGDVALTSGAASRG
jgi:hypothetical protein